MKMIASIGKVIVILKALIISCLVAPLAFGDECRDILTNGFFNELTSHKAQSQQQAVYAQLCASDYNQAKTYVQKAESSGSSASGGISYGPFGASASGGNSASQSATQEQFNEWKSTFCSQNSSSNASAASEFLMQKTVSEKVVNEWSKCMTDREGLSCYSTPYSQQVLLNIVWKKSSLSQPKISQSYLSPGSVAEFDGSPAGKLLPSAYLINPGTMQIPVSKPKNSSLVANLNMVHDGSAYSCSFYVPADDEFQLSQPSIETQKVISPDLGCKTQAFPFGNGCNGSWSYKAPPGYDVCAIHFAASSGPTEGAKLLLNGPSKKDGTVAWNVVPNTTPFGPGRWINGKVEVTFVTEGNNSGADGNACNYSQISQ